MLDKVRDVGPFTPSRGPLLEGLPASLDGLLGFALLDHRRDMLKLLGLIRREGLFRRLRFRHISSRFVQLLQVVRQRIP